MGHEQEGRWGWEKGRGTNRQSKAREAQKTMNQMKVLGSPQSSFTRPIPIKVSYSIHPRAFLNWVISGLGEEEWGSKRNHWLQKKECLF